MRESSSRLLEWALRLLLPAPSQHRAAKTRVVVQHTTPRAARPQGSFSTLVGLSEGDDRESVALVRPYVLMHEQRSRRRALWLATHGIDIGPRFIHGVEVAR
jgi:hypothetical protein